MLVMMMMMAVMMVMLVMMVIDGGDVQFMECLLGSDSALETV